MLGLDNHSAVASHGSSLISLVQVSYWRCSELFSQVATMEVEKPATRDMKIDNVHFGHLDAALVDFVIVRA